MFLLVPTPGPAWVCQAAGSSAFPPASHPVSEAEGGGHLATGPNQRIHDQERMEAAERCCDPPADADQGYAGKKSPEQEEKKCKFREQWRALEVHLVQRLLLLRRSKYWLLQHEDFIYFSFPKPKLLFVPFLQMYLSAKQREEEQRALLARQAHLEEVLRQAKEAKSDSITDQEMVDTIFNFLPPLMNKQEGPAGSEVGSLQSFTHSEFKVSDCMFPFVVRILKGEG